MTKTDLVVGIDCSTSACKGLIFDSNGTAVAEGRSTLSITNPQPDWHEQPAMDWWKAMVQALRQAVGQIDSGRLAALCITHQRETFVPVDDQGRPLRNGILWMDERARPLLAPLQERIGKENFHQVTGKPLSINLTLVKIAWLRENEPEIFDRVYKYLDVHAYLVQHLTGLYRTAWGCADPTGLFDMTQNCWAEQLINQVGIRADQLPEVLPTGAILGAVTAEAARESGLPAGLPVVGGIGDGQAGALGAGIIQSGDAYLILGTSVISGTYGEQYTIDRAFRTMCGGIPGTYLLETALLGGTYTVDWFIEKFSNQTEKNRVKLLTYWDSVARQVPPGCQGLMLVPYWSSVMNPYWDAAASGIVVGWRGIHRPGHLYRAILEGIAFEQRLYTGGVEVALNQKVQRFVIMGGGARSDLWCQIVADISGIPVYRTNTSEAAALGAAVLAAAAVGLHPDTRQAACAMTHILPYPFTPDLNRHTHYTRLYEEVYQHLFPALQPYLDRLTELSE